MFSVPRLSAHVGSADSPVGCCYTQRGRSQYSFRFSLVFATFMWTFRAFRRATISRSAFMGRRATTAPVVASKATVRMQQLPVFTNAMAEFKAEYPDFAKRGWGATVKAEVRLLDASVTLCGAELAHRLPVGESYTSWFGLTVVTKRAVRTSDGVGAQQLSERLRVLDPGGII